MYYMFECIYTIIYMFIVNIWRYCTCTEKRASLPIHRWIDVEVISPFGICSVYAVDASYCTPMMMVERLQTFLVFVRFAFMVNALTWMSKLIHFLAKYYTHTKHRSNIITLCTIHCLFRVHYVQVYTQYRVYISQHLYIRPYVMFMYNGVF